MKKLYLFIVILFSSLLIQAQSCEDVVYPTKGRSVIFDCCIREVKDGNQVRFTKNDSTYTIEAISIIKAGLTLNLIPLSSEPYNNVVYKGHHYSYYADRYEQASQKKLAGIIISSLGVGELLTGLVLLETAKNPTPQIFLMVGTITFGVGMSIAISGGVEASNNKKAMEKVKNSTKLTLGATNHGIGLVLSF